MNANAQQVAIEVGGWALDVPTALLLVMFMLLFWIVWRAERQGLNWADGFRDDSLKTSFLRLAVLVALMISAWQVMSLTLRVQPSLDLVERLSEFFIVVWSGTKIVEKIVDVLAVKFGVKPPPSPQ